MRVKKGRLVIIIEMVLILLATFLFSTESQAENIDFSQNILSAKFIYLDSGLEVKNIWSNVSTKDEAYVIKFFDLKKQAEINMNIDLLDKYKQFEERNALHSYSGLNENMDVAIYFIQKNSRLEEVRTFV
jgi:hypothetical protein